MTDEQDAGGGVRPAREADDHLALALDVSDLDEALRLWRMLAGSFAVAKVGLELFSSAGPAAIGALAAEGALVFADVKLHDIPSTVARAARALAAAGAHLVTVHACGSEAMVRGAVEGFVEGREKAGNGTPTDSIPAGILAVTVLTSEPRAPAEVLRERTRLAARSGCAGLVCAAGDLAVVREAAPHMLRVVPGVRLAGVPAHDQARVATPFEAIREGADLLVVGRSVTSAPVPEEAAAEVVYEVRRAKFGV